MGPYTLLLTEEGMGSFPRSLGLGNIDKAFDVDLVIIDGNVATLNNTKKGREC